MAKTMAAVLDDMRTERIALERWRTESTLPLSIKPEYVQGVIDGITFAIGQLEAVVEA